MPDIRNTLTYKIADYYDTNILPQIEHIRGATKISKTLRKICLASYCNWTVNRWEAAAAGIRFEMEDLNDMRYLYMEPDIVQEVADHIQKDDVEVFFDVGAYHGFYTVLSGSRINVVSFEQSRKNADKIFDNYRWAEQVIAPVWSSNEVLKSPKDSEGSTLQIGTGEDVSAVTLDEYKDREPGLIKIDVEGAEYHVLQGAEEILEEHRPYLIIELHGDRIKGATESIVKEYLRDKDYTIEEIGERGRETHIKAVPSNR